MARVFKTLLAYINGAGTHVTIADHLQPAKDNDDLLALGCFARNLAGGGSEIVGIGVGAGTGNVTAFNSPEFEIDNSGLQITNTASILVCRVRVCLRVGDASISVTPRVFNTDGSVPSQSGAAACSATPTDFSGANQKQTIAFVPKTGVNRYVVQGAKSADTFSVWIANIEWDLYING